MNGHRLWPAGGPRLAARQVAIVIGGGVVLLMLLSCLFFIFVAPWGMKWRVEIGAFAELA